MLLAKLSPPAPKPQGSEEADTGSSQLGIFVIRMRCTKIFKNNLSEDHKGIKTMSGIKKILLLALAITLTGCLGSGSGTDSNSGSSPPPIGGLPENDQVEPPVETLPPDQHPVTPSGSLRLLDTAQTLAAADFGLEDWAPRAVALHGNTVYIANDRNPGSVLRYNQATEQVLDKIDGISASEGFNKLPDLTVHGDRLYTSSLSSNRVDIFDLSGASPAFIMSLGTGSWAGASDKVLVHPMAVAANDKYVFAADTHQRISVWQQGDVLPEKHKQAVKHAYLELTDCSSIWCSVKLEATPTRLYASFDNGKTLVYDVAELARSTTLIKPIQQQASVANAYVAGGNASLYAARTSGTIDGFATSEILAEPNSILGRPHEQFVHYFKRGDPAEQKLGKSRDFAVGTNLLASIQGDNRVVVAPLREISEESGSGAQPAVRQYRLDAIATHQQATMLRDGEPWETLTDPALRSFRIDRILSGKASKTGIELSSYSAVPVTDLEIQARFKGSQNWFLLGHLDRLPAFSTIRLQADIRDGEAFARVDGQGFVRLSGLEHLEYYPSDLLDVRLASKTDKHVQKLSEIKPTWKILFGKYSRADGAWEKITPVYAREWVIMITNFAWILSSPEFEHLWFNHQKVMGHEFFGNAGRVEGPGGFFKPEDYPRYFRAIMNRAQLRLGVTTIGGGLGGGDVLGIDTWFFYSHYFNADIGVIGHEFGHHWGSHGSAWANAGWGLQLANLQLHQYFQRKKQLPYMDPDVNKFHLTPREELYNGIAESMRKPRPDSHVNPLERYFAANPL
ncbi:YncE family protein [Crenobacter caeni]|uniref:Beta-propeller fold lactonase family protein n=1 Tax=Crenobacter caeni TaxID=2705474 RepID=A0A6B2KS72_9NEIS|nr:hypothetical protein [Crenobacter caeni]NDV12940.1 hypothetical protein [Crenobacter caeni]